MVKKIDRFLLREVLSDGPAGTVYKAEEMLPGDNRRSVALKVLPQIETTAGGDSPREQRFFGEVRVLAQLAVHPHIVTLYAMGLTEGFPWLAMEYAPVTLEQKILETPGDAGEVLKLLEQVGRGLAAMHSLKPALLHQDLKPANVLLDFLNNYKITDFSLATVTASNRTHGIATVRYAAPELLSGEFGRVGPGTDLYALGHIAYEFALGRRLHAQQFPAVFEGNVQKEPPPSKWMMWHASANIRAAPVDKVVSEFPPGLAAIVARLIAKIPAERYGSAAELLSDLSVLRQEALVPAASVPGASPGVRPAQAAGLAGRGISAAASPVSRAASGGSGGSGAPIELAPLGNAALAGGAAPAAASSGSAAGVPAAGVARYWVRLRGRVSGPFDLPTLQRQVKQGVVSRLHQLSADQVTWKSAAEIEGLYGPVVVDKGA
jgi:serine/threonine-protein kinase